MEKKKNSHKTDVSIADLSRADKVKAIQQRVEAGTYRVDNRDLADSLLADLLWEQWEKIRFYKPS